jgi:hypothetical protein
MPNAQYIDGRFIDFVSHFIATNDDPADLARFELFQPLADARMIEQTAGAAVSDCTTRAAA